MSAAALIYVGAVLFINGLLLLNWLTPREAGPINLFVGGLQIFTPIYLIVTAADGDSEAVFAAAGIFLFGFTYLWVGINCVKDYSNRGFGWFALFVALCCVVFALNNFFSVGDFGFGVIWLLWGILWFLFFLVLGLELERMTAATSFFTVIVAIITAVAAFQQLLQNWTGGVTEAIILAIIGAVALIVGHPVGRLVSVANKEAVG